MKISLTEATAKALIDHLSDEQPGSPLDDLRRQLQHHVSKPGLPLTVEELDFLLDVVYDKARSACVPMAVIRKLTEMRAARKGRT